MLKAFNKADHALDDLTQMATPTEQLLLRNRRDYDDEFYRIGVISNFRNHLTLDSRTLQGMDDLIGEIKGYIADVDPSDISPTESWQEQNYRELMRVLENPFEVTAAQLTHPAPRRLPPYRAHDGAPPPPALTANTRLNVLLDKLSHHQARMTEWMLNECEETNPPFPKYVSRHAGPWSGDFADPSRLAAARERRLKADKELNESIRKDLVRVVRDFAGGRMNTIGAARIAKQQLGIDPNTPPFALPPAYFPRIMEMAKDISDTSAITELVFGKNFDEALLSEEKLEATLSSVIGEDISQLKVSPEIESVLDENLVSSLSPTSKKFEPYRNQYAGLIYAALNQGDKRLALFLLLNTGDKSIPYRTKIMSHHAKFPIPNIDSKENILKNSIRRRITADIAKDFIDAKVAEERSNLSPEERTKIEDAQNLVVDSSLERIIALNKFREMGDPNLYKIIKNADVSSGVLDTLQVMSPVHDNAYIRTALEMEGGKEYMGQRLYDLNEDIKAGRLNEIYGLQFVRHPEEVADYRAEVKDRQIEGDDDLGRPIIKDAAIGKEPLIPLEPAPGFTRFYQPTMVKVKKQKNRLMEAPETGESVRQLQNLRSATYDVLLAETAIDVKGSSVDVQGAMAQIMDEPNARASV
jgi:hypothetical protein